MAKNFRTLPATILLIFCKIILNPQVIVKCMKDPENNFKGNLSALVG